MSRRRLVVDKEIFKTIDNSLLSPDSHRIVRRPVMERLPSLTALPRGDDRHKSISSSSSISATRRCSRREEPLSPSSIDAFSDAPPSILNSYRIKSQSTSIHSIPWIDFKWSVNHELNERCSRHKLLRQPLPINESVEAVNRSSSPLPSPN